MSPSKSARPSVRDRILATASDLFYREGVQNVGIDRIVAESGVAKMSLYNHFKSKDALITACLEQRDIAWGQWFEAEVMARASQPCDRMLVIFDVLQDWFEAPDFRGCAFINTTVELANVDHPGCRVALRHHQFIEDFLLQLLGETALPNINVLAQQLSILIDGAIIVAQMQCRSDAARYAKSAASRLLQA